MAVFGAVCITVIAMVFLYLIAAFVMLLAMAEMSITGRIVSLLISFAVASGIIYSWIILVGQRIHIN